MFKIKKQQYQQFRMLTKSRKNDEQWNKASVLKDHGLQPSTCKHAQCQNTESASLENPRDRQDFKKHVNKFYKHIVSHLVGYLHKLPLVSKNENVWDCTLSKTRSDQHPGICWRSISRRVGGTREGGPTRGALRFCAVVGSAQTDTQFWQMFACVYMGKAVDSTSGNHTKLL